MKHLEENHGDFFSSRDQHNLLIQGILGSNRREIIINGLYLSQV